MCATSGAGNGKLSGASNFIPGFNAQSSFQCSVVGFFFLLFFFFLSFGLFYCLSLLDLPLLVSSNSS
jgi:hypothetical protein